MSNTVTLIHPQELNPGDQWRGCADIWIVDRVVQTLDGRVTAHVHPTESGPGGWITWTRGDLVPVLGYGPSEDEVAEARAQAERGDREGRIFKLLVDDVLRVSLEIEAHDPKGGRDLITSLDALIYNLHEIRRGTGGEVGRVQQLMRASLVIGRFKGMMEVRRGRRGWPLEVVTAWENTLFDVFQALVPDAKGGGN